MFTVHDDHEKKYFMGIRIDPFHTACFMLNFFLTLAVEKKFEVVTCIIFRATFFIILCRVFPF